MAYFYVFFVLSGFCSVLYELIWLRLSMAQFGVTTALTSIVLSVFMAGLGAGSWAAGVLIRRYGERVKSPLRLYALIEALIGVSALVVPLELVRGHRLLERLATQSGLSSNLHYLFAGLWLAATLIPWCACMGATFPVAMLAIRSYARSESRRSFSFLYPANVLGAAAGAVLPLLLIEAAGFHRTSQLGAMLNFAIAAWASVLAGFLSAERFTPTPELPTVQRSADASYGPLLLLFTTGLVTMGMELIWIRIFTPYVGPVVYTFGLVLVAYLTATLGGSRYYRNWSHTHSRENRLAWISLAIFGVLPLLSADGRMPLNPVGRIIWGVMPVAGMMGFLTPLMVERWSGGDPDRTGRAYAVNVLGCILGPLLSGFILLPNLGEHRAILVLSLPWFLFAFVPSTAESRPLRRGLAYGSLVAALLVYALTKDLETFFPKARVLRDSSATVIATGEGMHRQLFVNGIGMTVLTPIAKMMAHYSLASFDHPPQKALVICFGMGTTFRSVISWGISGTTVELIPSVPQLFTYYHPDGAQVLASPMAHLVVDDGRRFLERSPEKFDVIIIDPPPPVQAAGSSLLYSQEFYVVARQRLETGGILAQWLPAGADTATIAAVARALKNSFPYVRVYRSVSDGWGLHFFASEQPIPDKSPAELVAAMPKSAVRDMMEWGPAKTPVEQFGLMTSRRVALESLIEASPQTPALQDDRPINEYFLVRKLFAGLTAAR